MDLTTLSAPIIIIGMHRSGTSMIAEFLRKMDLFLGRDIDAHFESNFFYRANEWLFRLAGASWDNPQAVNVLLENRQARKAIIAHLRRYCASMRTWFFLRGKGSLMIDSVSMQRFIWGWKDPRTTFTLPLWLELFPNAKVIHVYRHGTDVANSLIVRQKKGFTLLKNKMTFRRGTKYFLYPLDPYFLRSIHLTSHGRGIKLWGAYYDNALRLLNGLPEDRCFNLKYEEFIEAPRDRIIDLARFCSLSINGKILADVIGQVDKTRAYTYLGKKELYALAMQYAEDLRLRGY